MTESISDGFIFVFGFFNNETCVSRRKEKTWGGKKNNDVKRRG